MTTTPPELIQVSPNRAWLPVRAAAVINTALTNTPETMNGVALGPTRDRVLLTGQSSGSANGLYQLTESGAVTNLSVAASASTTETVAASRLAYVVVTGTVTVTGANGTVTAGNPGFLAPLSGPTRLAISGGESGGSVAYQAAVGLTRTADADADLDFASGKIADVRLGTNAGIWILAPTATLPLTNSLSLVFRRTYQAAQTPLNPTAALTSTAPDIKPLNFIFALTTSLGALTSHIGGINGLI